MTYDQARRRAIRDALGSRIEHFARSYRPGEPTVVFLPGGMGSQLDQSKKRYQGTSTPPFTEYDPVWIDFGILFNGDALKLEIRLDGRDYRNHVIIPDGPLQFLVSAYDGTERYFQEDKGWNYIVFG